MLCACSALEYLSPAHLAIHLVNLDPVSEPGQSSLSWWGLRWPAVHYLLQKKPSTPPLGYLYCLHSAPLLHMSHCLVIVSASVLPGSKLLEARDDVSVLSVSLLHEQCPALNWILENIYWKTKRSSWYKGDVINTIMPSPKDVPVSIPGSCEYVTSHGKGN